MSRKRKQRIVKRVSNDDVDICFNCGGNDIRVTDTRHRGNSRLRVRECSGCGYRYSTIEIGIDYFNQLKDYEDTVLYLRGKL